MSSKNIVCIMLKRRCEELKIILEEVLMGSFFNEDKITAGKECFKSAVLDFLGVANHELTKLVLKVPFYKIEEKSGIISFGLKDTAQALRKLVGDINFWILRFINAMLDDQIWSQNIKIVKSLYKLMKDAIDELSISSAMEVHIPKDDKVMINNLVKNFEKSNPVVYSPKLNKLSLKKKRLSRMAD